MSGVKVYLVVTMVLSLLACALSIASQAKAIIFYKDTDSLSGSGTTTMDTNAGYFTFVLAAASLAAIGYIVLLIMAGMDKEIHSGPGLLMMMSVIVLQFGVATIMLVNLRNTRVAYDTNMANLATLEAAGATGAAVDILRTYVVT